VFASSRSTSSCALCRLLRGSNTRRTGDDLSDSSRIVSSASANNAFRFTWSCDSDFLPSRGLGLVARSTSSITTRADTPNGSSVTAMRHWPRASSSTVQRARTRRLPRPDSYTARMSSARRLCVRRREGPVPGICSSSSSMSIFGLRMVATTAPAISRRLCGGMSVAMPTPMPDAPFARSIGSRAGRSFGSWNAPS
jgi:hypothetical protein